jgi:ribosomal protein S18 acetylase RimI-like enzyme
MERAMLGVDEMNQTGAMRLYSKVGFTVKTRHLSYLRRL